MENQHLIAQLLTLAGQPTAGNVSAIIPQLTGLEFEARLVLATDSAAGAPTTRSLKYTWMMRHDGRTSHVRRRRSAAC